jgi:general secretion pathway protein D
MKKVGWLWKGFLILFLIAEAISFSGAQSVLNAEPNSGTFPAPTQKESSTQLVAVIPPLTALSNPQQETAITGAVSQVSKPEKLTEPRVPTSLPTPTPIPTQKAAQATPQAPTRAATPTQAQVQTPAAAPAPTPAPPPPPVIPKVPAKGSGFVFNFDNADLYEVIRVMAEIMKINYIIDPRVRGVANIHTSGQISAEDILPIFQTVLKLNGATAVLKDNVYQIVPFGDAKKMYTRSTIPSESGVFPEEKYIIQIITVKFIPVTEVSKLIKPFLSDGADIVENPPNNILIIGDLASNVKKSLDIIGLFDIDIFTDLRVRIYPILNADVTEVAKEMERIFSSFEVSTKSGRGVGITFTPITRINSLLVVSAIPNIFERVEGWLKELDKIPTEGTKFSVFVYYVQNAKAKDLADVLKQIFVTTKDKKVEYKEKVVTPEQPTGQRSVRPPTTPTPPTTPPTEAKGEEGAVPEGEINIVVDEPNNALVIRAFARDYRTILDTIKKLDIYPKQVLIELFLAEVTLGDLNEFGLEWSKFSESFTQAGHTFDYTIGLGGGTVDPLKFLSGIRYTIDEVGRISAAVHASATAGRLKVISSPHLLASNNKEAKIQIGVSQPILTNTYTTGVTTTTNTTMVEGTIEYKDVGIILSVTPRISDGGLVTMDISIENSTVGTTTLGSLSNVPVFNKKTAKTTLSIVESQTIVIGGLIEESKDTSKSGVPWLSKIPILGGLFGFQKYDKKRTELVVLLTPHVITDLGQSNAVTREFRERIETIRKDLEEKKKEKK